MGWCPMKSFTLDSKQRKDIERRRRQASDKRIFSRLSALLWLAEGMTQQQVASRLGVSSRQVCKWVRLFRGSTLDAFCTLNYRGDPGKLRPPQLERLKAEIQKGRFHTARQVRDWIAQTFHHSYSESGIKDLLHRIGASFHKVSGFFWKADRKKQKAFVRKYRRQKRRAGPETRRYFVDACHPVWGVELLYSCWLLVSSFLFFSLS
jgi:transposase